MYMSARVDLVKYFETIYKSFKIFFFSWLGKENLMVYIRFFFLFKKWGQGEISTFFFYMYKF